MKQGTKQFMSNREQSDEKIGPCMWVDYSDDNDEEELYGDLEEYKKTNLEKQLGPGKWNKERGMSQRVRVEDLVESFEEFSRESSEIRKKCDNRI